MYFFPLQGTGGLFKAREIDSHKYLFAVETQM
uniref:Uncharacterized protein n=1 Tax=Arundo donax TaxID=35708 RepID=A0A0A9HKQ4_ARUDO